MSVDAPRLVVLESPYAGYAPRWAPWGTKWLFAWFNGWLNRRYAIACMRDSLYRNEAPYASHVLYASSGALDDSDLAQRTRGMHAGFAWGYHAAKRVFYCDRGMSGGMRMGLYVNRLNQIVEYRYIYKIAPRCEVCAAVLAPNTRCVCLIPKITTIRGPKP